MNWFLAPALIVALLGLLSLSEATRGAGLIAFAVFLSVLGRIAQAEAPRGPWPTGGPSPYRVPARAASHAVMSRSSQPIRRAVSRTGRGNSPSRDIRQMVERERVVRFRSSRTVRILSTASGGSSSAAVVRSRPMMRSWSHGIPYSERDKRPYRQLSRCLFTRRGLPRDAAFAMR